jgi:hypothetical protein
LFEGTSGHCSLSFHKGTIIRRRFRVLVLSRLLSTMVAMSGRYQFPANNEQTSRAARV